ncbi:uncharacterized protein CTRU02_214538 [Colletotrichum truncatum]|uniref:Uncharacterized protein n=1 Tax=Colletotrichum truncatum TaxID=5467 RepID=A0ACC3YF28_COLTU
MADPLAILGSVAASFQLVEVAAKTLLGTLKFVRELRDIPRKTAAQLDDVDRSTERVRYMCTSVLGAGSVAVDNVDSAILARLSTCADGLRSALDEAQGMLKPLVDGYDAAKNKPVRRLWNAVVSTTRESSILDRLQKIDKLNLEMVGELQIAGFAVQADIRIHTRSDFDFGE